MSRPYRPVWRYLRDYVAAYDASIFSLAAFSQPLPHPSYLIAPGIDPLSEKNRDLDPEEIALGLHADSRSIRHGPCCCRCLVSIASRIRWA